MKILLVHSYYQQKGGEDAVFEQEYELLKHSEDVETVIFRNLPGWRGAVQFLFSVWNPVASYKIRKTIKRFHPDIIQIYNWHYASGPAAVRIGRKTGVPTVINIQNYRLLCPSATLIYGGKLFISSLEKNRFPWEAVYKKVYRNSAIQTFWLAFVVRIHKRMGTWKKIDRYIVPTQEMKKLFTTAANFRDVRPEKFCVKSNFSIQTALTNLPRENHFLFVGRLSEEKGILFLLDAFRNMPFELVIAGEGPLIQQVLDSCSRHKNIRFVGKLDKSGVKDAMSRCAAFIFSSIWYEPFGLVITEALSNGCPVIASDIGSPVELVQEGITGLHFKTGDQDDLQKKLNEWQNLSVTVKEQFRQNCIASYHTFYGPEVNRKQLMAIYNSLKK